MNQIGEKERGEKISCLTALISLFCFRSTVNFMYLWKFNNYLHEYRDNINLYWLL